MTTPDESLADAEERAERDRAAPNEEDSIYEKVDPWPEPVDGLALLEELIKFFSDVVVLPEGGYETCALYTVVTYIPDLLELCSYLNVRSATMRSGKTAIATLLSYVVMKPFMTGNASPAVIFRECEANHPTLIIDEGDSFIELAEELRNVLNNGYDSNLFVSRVERRGNQFVTRRFSPFGPKIIAGIGVLPDTVGDRCIKLVTRRKRPTDQVLKFRRLQRREFRQRGQVLRQRLTRWVQDNRAALNGHAPAIPDELDDRAADNWEPLLIVADIVGGRWPDEARRVAKLLSADRRQTTEEEQLLRDVQQIFSESRSYDVLNTDGSTEWLPGNLLTPNELANRLRAMEERPWQEYGPRQTPITTDKLGKLLSGFDVKSQKASPVDAEGNVIGKQRRFYWPELFHDAWSRHEICSDCEPTFTFRRG